MKGAKKSHVNRGSVFATSKAMSFFLCESGLCARSILNYQFEKICLVFSKIWKIHFMFLVHDIDYVCVKSSLNDHNQHDPAFTFCGEYIISVANIWPRTQFGFPWFSVCILISFLIGVYLPLSSTSSHKMTELKILGLCTWKTTNERRGGWSENRFPVLS